MPTALREDSSLQVETASGIPPTMRYSLKSLVSSLWMNDGMLSCHLNDFRSRTSCVLFCASKNSSKDKGSRCRSQEVLIAFSVQGLADRASPSIAIPPADYSCPEKISQYDTG